MTQDFVQDHTSPSKILNFQEIIAPYKGDLLQVNEVIYQGSQNVSLPFIKEISTHHFQSGGKRIRPLLTIILAHALKADIKRAYNLAACIELIHAASLIHDDVLDESLKRRGIPSINALWDNRISILAGDYFFAQAFSCMVEDASQDVYKILAQASKRITEGELCQISIQRNLSTSFEDYKNVIERKTASLFQAACSVSCYIAKTSDNQKQSIESFGKRFGYIFQLVDDYLDYMGDTLTLGKNLGKDLLEGKITFPILDAYQKGSWEEKDFWEKLFSKEYQHTKKDLETIQDLLKKHDVQKTLQTLLVEEKEQALKDLSCLQESNHRRTLEYLVHFIVNRDF